MQGFKLLASTFAFTFAFGGFVVANSAVADEIKVGTDARKNLSVAIYNGDLALVKDTRTISLVSGVNDIAFVDVSAQIQPETALLQGKGFAVLEQDFNFDLLSPSSLLDKYVGKDIKVITTNPANGVEKTENAVVLSNNGGTVLKIGNRIETDFKGRLVFPDIPDNLRDRPTLVVKADAKSRGRTDVQLAYLTRGLSWAADYVAELDNDEKTMSLNGWVTLTNTSGVAYENANLQLVAGDVNRVQREMVSARMMKANAMDFAAPASAGMREESFMDYHLYSLNRETSILANQTKQVALLASPRVAVEKNYRIDNLFHLFFGMQKSDYQPRNPNVILKFVNNDVSGLGMPLPAGVFRVYKADSKGQVLFVGEDRIRHTPKREEVKIKMGQAFDVTAKVKITDFKKLADKAYQVGITITFSNAKDSDVSVAYYQDLPIGYRIISESITSKKEGANQVLWNVFVPRNSDKVLKLEIFVAG